jgi:two-component system sensor histidine kinase DegS
VAGTPLATTDTPAPLNPSALAGVRFLVSRRIEELDAAAGRLDAALAETSQRRSELREKLEDSEITWGHVVRNLSRFKPDDVDNAFHSLAGLRADLALLEERARDNSARLIDLRSEQEVMRSVYRSLDDLATANGAVPTGNARLRNASRQVFQIIEEERMRIARDMHDGPAQSLANLVLQAEILERLIDRDPQMVVRELVDFKAGVRTVLDETRRLIFDLRPMTLDDLGLVPTLRKFLTDYSERSGIESHLRVVGEETRLPETYEPTVFRIVQESLNNARKHAQARSVEVIITFRPGAVEAVVKDDGMGFDVAATEARLDAHRNLGMISMRERADLEKGNLQIRSQIGKGTEVRVSFQFDRR